MEVYDFIICNSEEMMQGEIIIFFYNQADDVLGNSLTFQDSEVYDLTDENLRVLVEYFVEMKNYHLTCKKCNQKQFDKEIVIDYWLKSNPSQPPHDIDYECGSCDTEKRGVVGRNYTDVEDEL